MTRLVLDFRLDTPGFEVSALRTSISTLEQQLDELRSRRGEEARQFIAALDPKSEGDHTEAQLVRQELEWEVDHTYPRIYRGALLLLVWAAYESGVEEVAEYIQERIPAVLGLSDIRGRTTLERATKYFPGVLKFELFNSPNSPSRLRQIELVRNSFAHANGRVDRASDSGRKSLEALVTSGKLEEGWGMVRPTEMFLRSALDLVESELISLVARAKAWDDARKARSSKDAAPS